MRRPATPKLLSWWTLKRYGIRMQVTELRGNEVFLWDRTMHFKWEGTRESFSRQFVRKEGRVSL